MKETQLKELNSKSFVKNQESRSDLDLIITTQMLLSTLKLYREESLKDLANGIIDGLGRHINALVGRLNNFDIDKMVKHSEDREQLLRLFNDISQMQLSLSRIVKYNSELKQKLNIREQVNWVFSMFRSELIRKKINWKIDLEEKLEADLDQLKFQQLLVPLIKNAIESFNLITIKRDDEANKLIYVNSHVHSNKIILSITDNGLGIDSKNIDKVFDLGFSTKHKNSKSTHITGIGLSYAKSLAQDLGVKISFYSELNLGTTFEIVIPRVNSINKDQLQYEEGS